MMKEMIKKAGITFWFNAVAAVLSLVALILFAVTNGTQGYSVYNGGLGIALSVLGLIAVCGMTVSSLKFGSQHFLTAVLRVATIVFLFAAFGILLSDRVGLASSLFTWDSHNTIGWGALYNSIACAIMLLVAVILLTVNAFLNSEKNEAAV